MMEASSPYAIPGNNPTMKVENKLKSLFTLYATINLLTAEEKAEHLVEFYNMDKNKDGHIDFE